jgi:hypothetical protein
VRVRAPTRPRFFEFRIGALVARPLIRRFHPGAYTAREAYVRATETPREVRQLGEAMVGWALTNVIRDRNSTAGDLPARYGFSTDAPDSARVDTVYSIALSEFARVHVSADALWCVPIEGGVTCLRSLRFEPMRADTPSELARAIRCKTPADWVLGWNHVAAGLRLLADYEAWAQKRFVAGRSDDRPKAARKTEVSAQDLPAALRALSEWAGDGEQAMLAWIIADAESRGAEPDLPPQYRRNRFVVSGLPLVRSK